MLYRLQRMDATVSYKFTLDAVFREPSSVKLGGTENLGGISQDMTYRHTNVGTSTVSMCIVMVAGALKMREWKMQEWEKQER